jgi:hypothetical protein
MRKPPCVRGDGVTPPSPLGAVVCVLRNGRTYVIAPDGNEETDVPRVRLFATHRDTSQLTGEDDQSRRERQSETS